MVNLWWIPGENVVLIDTFLASEKFPLFLNLFFGWTNWMVVSWPSPHGQVESIGIFAAAKMAHLSDDETVAKMGHPILVELLDVGHPSNAN
jgi:hypothetical protein